MLNDGGGLVGEKVTVTLGGEKIPLVFSFNSIAQAEELTGLNLLFRSSLDPWQSARVLRALVWAGIQHLGRTETLDEIGGLIGEAGPGNVLAEIFEAWTASMPSAEDIDADPEETERPFVTETPS
jgi:hypothetical protein